MSPFPVSVYLRDLAGKPTIWAIIISSFAAVFVSGAPVFPIPGNITLVTITELRCPLFPARPERPSGDNNPRYHRGAEYEYPNIIGTHFPTAV